MKLSIILAIIATHNAAAWLFAPSEKLDCSICKEPWHQKSCYIAPITQQNTSCLDCLMNYKYTWTMQQLERAKGTPEEEELRKEAEEAEKSRCQAVEDCEIRCQENFNKDYNKCLFNMWGYTGNECCEIDWLAPPARNFRGADGSDERFTKDKENCRVETTEQTFNATTTEAEENSTTEPIIVDV